MNLFLILAAFPASTTIAAPSTLVNVWAVGYHDQYDMLYVGGPPSGNLYYGSYDGSGLVSWIHFDNLQNVCGFGCYDDNLLFAISQKDPYNPGPFYLYTWTLNGSGVPQLPADVYELGSPFVGTFGGCEWDGDNLWILDQNFQPGEVNATVYRYDVFSHTVEDQWNYGELGGVGVACVWDTSNLSIWISDWYGGYKIVEHEESGTPTGQQISISTNSTDLAFKYNGDIQGSGFFVGNHDNNNIVFYPYTLSPLSRTSWGGVKNSF